MTKITEVETTRIQLSTIELSALCDGQANITRGEQVFPITPDDLSIPMDELVQGGEATLRNHDNVVISA